VSYLQENGEAKGLLTLTTTTKTVIIKTYMENSTFSTGK
jgi:hypothetical protein